MKISYSHKKDYTANEKRILSICRELDEAYKI